jgi:hypothetical protein
MNKILRKEEISSEVLWSNVRQTLKEDSEASLVFDDMV